MPHPQSGPPRRRPGFRRTAQGNDVVLRDSTGETAFAFNDTALALWEICDGVTTVDEMVAAIVVLSGRDEASIRTDVEATIVEMRVLGILEN